MTCIWIAECKELKCVCEDCYIEEYVDRYDRQEYEIEYEEYIRGFYGFIRLSEAKTNVSVIVDRLVVKHMN